VCYSFTSGMQRRVESAKRNATIIRRKHAIDERDRSAASATVSNRRWINNMRDGEPKPVPGWNRGRNRWTTRASCYILIMLTRHLV
jgi:hypothetical protein